MNSSTLSPSVPRSIQFASALFSTMIVNLLPKAIRNIFIPSIVFSNNVSHKMIRVTEVRYYVRRFTSAVTASN